MYEKYLPDETADERNAREARQLAHSLLQSLEHVDQRRLELGWAGTKHGKHVPPMVREALRDALEISDAIWHLRNWLDSEEAPDE